jgi:hypothetical protein
MFIILAPAWDAPNHFLVYEYIYFWQKEVSVWDHHAVCVCVCVRASESVWYEYYATERRTNRLLI